MKIDFRPVAKFSEVLVGENVSNDAKTVDRYFAYLKQGNNPYLQRPRVMKQTIEETSIGWLVTNMEVFDSKTGRVIKSLNRNVDEEGNFITKIMTLSNSGKKQEKTVEHPAK